MANEIHITESPLIRKAVFATLIITSLFLLAATGNQLRRPDNPNAAPAQISVSGTGEVFAIPDIAFITFDVRKEAKNIALAQQQVNDIVAPVLKDLQAKGIAEKDIKTVNYSSYPVYDYRATPVCTSNSCPPSQNQTLRGYEVAQSIQIKVRNTDTAGDILTYLGTKAVTNINGPTYSIDDETAITAQAREKAIADAKVKAQALAKQLGVRLGKILSFNEGTNYPYIGYERAMSADAKTEPAPAPVSVPKGENKYTSNVTITYELR